MGEKKQTKQKTQEKIKLEVAVLDFTHCLTSFGS